MKIISTSEKDTAAFAQKIAKQLRGGETLALSGELGAGKTAFTKSLAKALGVRQSVSSPTFVVMRVYEISKHPSIKRFIHVDAYRVNKADSLIGIGLEDYINDKNAVVVIEWADLVKKILPKNHQAIRFSHTVAGREITY